MSQETRRWRWQFGQAKISFLLCLVFTVLALVEYLRAGNAGDLEYQSDVSDALMIFGLLTSLLGVIYFFLRHKLKENVERDMAAHEEPDEEELDEDDV